jgi:hypothetical protein
MFYEITETKVKFTKEGKLQQITVCVDDNGFKKYYRQTNKPMAGYYFLTDKSELSSDLLQKVAAGGFRVKSLSDK